MQQKLTITIDKEVYDALYRSVGKGNIGKFLENLARPHVMQEDLASAYRAMAADTDRELAALEWSNGLMLGEMHAVDEPKRDVPEAETTFGTSSPTARFHPFGGSTDA